MTERPILFSEPMVRAAKAGAPVKAIVILLAACAAAPRRPVANECVQPERPPPPRVINCNDPEYRCGHWHPTRTVFVPRSVRR